MMLYEYANSIGFGCCFFFKTEVWNLIKNFILTSNLGFPPLPTIRKREPNPLNNF